MDQTSDPIVSFSPRTFFKLNDVEWDHGRDSVSFVKWCLECLGNCRGSIPICLPQSTHKVCAGFRALGSGCCIMLHHFRFRSPIRSAWGIRFAGIHSFWRMRSSWCTRCRSSSKIRRTRLQQASPASPKDSPGFFRPFDAELGVPGSQTKRGVRSMFFLPGGLWLSPYFHTQLDSSVEHV